LTDKNDHRCRYESEEVYKPLVGQRCRIAVVGDLDRALAGEEGVYVLVEDTDIRYTNGKPYGEFYLWQLESGQSGITAESCVRELVRQSLGVETQIDPLMTSRGLVSLNTICYGVRAPTMPRHVLEILRRRVVAMIEEGDINFDEKL